MLKPIRKQKNPKSTLKLVCRDYSSSSQVQSSYLVKYKPKADAEPISN